MARPPPSVPSERILITGCSGLIGTRLIEDLVRDHAVLGLDLKPPPQAPAGFDWLECDLTRDEDVERVFETIRRRWQPQRIASVLHLAAYYDFSGEPSPLYEQLTVEGTRRVLRALQPFPVEQFVFSSTLLVMQPCEPGRALTEADPVRAEWDYPRSKLAAEEAIRAGRGAIPAVVLRIAGAYDEWCRSLPIAQQIRRIYERQLESHFFPGRTDRGQSFVHLDDLVALFRRTIERRRELDPFEVFLVGEPDVLSYGELQDQIGALVHGREWTTLRIPRPVAKTGAWLKEKLAGDKEEAFIKPWMVDLAEDHYPVDPSRARRRLGWEPRQRLRQTLAPMVRHLLEDPRRWYEENGLPLPAALREAE